MNHETRLFLRYFTICLVAMTIGLALASAASGAERRRVVEFDDRPPKWGMTGIVLTSDQIHNDRWEIDVETIDTTSLSTHFLYAMLGVNVAGYAYPVRVWRVRQGVPCKADTLWVNVSSSMKTTLRFTPNTAGFKDGDALMFEHVPAYSVTARAYAPGADTPDLTFHMAATEYWLPNTAATPVSCQ